MGLESKFIYKLKNVLFFISHRKQLSQNLRQLVNRKVLLLGHL